MMKLAEGSVSRRHSIQTTNGLQFGNLAPHPPDPGVLVLHHFLILCLNPFFLLR